MPRMPRRGLPRRDEDQLSERTRLHLLGGHDWSFMDGPAPAEDTLRAAWQQHGEALTAEHVAAHPGSRPWGWWRYDAPEPRQMAGRDWEPELPYLERHGLLTPAEREALRLDH